MVSLIFDLIASLRADGVTVLLVEQSARAAFAAADIAYVMETGLVILSRSASMLALDPRVQDAYLGGTVAR
jgi:branched-chain amino acid transport system ATP-binding protein